MQFADSLIALAGFAFAHATWSISDLPKGQLLVPLAIVEKAGQRQLIRFEAETQVKAIAKGKTTLAEGEKELSAWAFAREGQVREGGRYVDTLTIEAKVSGKSTTIKFVQKFQPHGSGKFKLLGKPMVVVGVDELPESEATPILEKLFVGVRSHAKAAEHWQEWSAP